MSALYDTWQLPRQPFVSLQPCAPGPSGDQSTGIRLTHAEAASRAQRALPLLTKDVVPATQPSAVQQPAKQSHVAASAPSAPDHPLAQTWKRKRADIADISAGSMPSAMSDKQQDDPTNDARAVWTLNEEKLLLYEHHTARQKGVFHRPGTWATKFMGIAEALNKKFHLRDPGMYPHERTGYSAYTKCKSMNQRFKKEQKLQREFKAAAQGTGSAAGRKAGEFKSNWPLFNLFHECCVEGSPADQDEQEDLGSVHRSALPGMPQPGADDVSDDSMLPDEPHSVARSFAKTKRARLSYSLNSQTPSDSKQAQPDLIPSMTNKEWHVNQMLRDSMQIIVAMHERSEQAADRRYQASLVFQYECMMYREKNRAYIMRCLHQMQDNKDIVAHNTLLLAMWEKTGGDPPQLLVPDLDPLPQPTPPKHPATRRADALAAQAAAEAKAAARTKAAC